MTKGKTYIYIIMCIAACLMTACTDTAFDDNEAQQLVPLTIEAQPEAATRTSLEGTSVEWSEGDEVAVFDFQASKHRFTSINTDGRTKFVGKVTAKSEPFAAIYPYELAAETGNSPAQLAATLPAEQYVVPDGFPAGMNISVAKGARNIDGSPSNVTFRNVCQLLRFTVPAYVAGKVTSIAFTAQTAVAGKLNIDYSGASPVVSIAQTESTAITVLPPRRTSTFDAGTYYILTAPVQLNGFSMTMQTTDSKTYRLASTTQFGGEVGRIYSLGSIDLVNTPTVTDCHHVYDANGILQGTSISVAGAPIEGKPWTVNVKNSSGKVIRTMTITGDSQTSDESDTSWPFIPAGEYTVECKCATSNNREVIKTMSKLKVTNPTLFLTVGGYTAHSLYENENIDGANDCDRSTIYLPSAKLSVTDRIMNTGNYSCSYTRILDYNNQTTTTTEKTNNPTWPDYEGVPVSGNLYTFSVSANFAGTEVSSANKKFRITGLPVKYEPPTKKAGWSSHGGKVTFGDNNVELGHNSLTGKTMYITCDDFYIPSGVKLRLYYDFTMKIDATATVTNTFTITAGENELFSSTITGALLSGVQSFNHNSDVTILLEGDVQQMKCYQSYGQGQTCTIIRSLNYKYGY